MGKLLTFIRRIQGLSTIVDYLKRNNEFLIDIRKKQDEILNSARFSDSVIDSQWFKYRNISAGNSAMDYGALYTLYRIIESVQPRRVLEFGLGQSSKIIHQYATFNEGVFAITYEHDLEWTSFFLKTINNLYAINVYKTELFEYEYKNEKTLSYKDNCKELLKQKYDLIVVDGPYGSKHYSRSQILHLIPYCLNERFCIMLDDVNRLGEQETVEEIEHILIENNIKYCKKIYSSIKQHIVICSNDLFFLTTM